MAQTLRVNIVGDASGYHRALNQATSATSSFGSALGRFAKTTALVTGGAGIAGIAIVLRQGQKEWTQHAKVAAQTEQVLKTTGEAAGVTQKQVEGLANALMLKTGIDDEAIQSSENLLLSFTRVRNEAGKGNDIFTRATRVIQDYSVRTGKSATQATMLFGKALQEVAIGKIPTSIRGLGKFSDAQVKMMKAMVASGDVAGAQGVILKMLEDRYGGAAEAAGNTLPGKINILKESFRNFSAELFKSVVPALTQLVDWTTAHMPQIEAVFKSVFTAIGASIRFGADVVRAIIPVVESVVSWFQDNWPEIERVTMRVFNAIAPVVINTFNTVKSVIMGAVSVIQGIWSRFGAQLTTIATTAFNYVKTTIQNALNVIRGIVNVFGGLLHGDWSRVWLGLQQIFGAVASQIVAVVRAWGTTVVQVLTIAGKAMLEAVSVPWNAIRSLAVSVFSSVVAAIRGMVGQTISAATAVGKGIVDGIQKGLSTIVAVVKGGLDKIWGVISNVAGLVYGAAKAIGAELIHGIADGIKGAIGGAVDAVKNAGAAVWHAAGSFFKIGSPSRLMADTIGKPIIEGIAKGMTDAARMLGPTLTRALTQSLSGIGRTTGTAIVRGLNPVGQMIVASARKWGVDARAALAVAMSEGGFKGAIGDSGTSFGPFQLHIGGELPKAFEASTAAAQKFANSAAGVDYALRRISESGARGKAGIDTITAAVRNFERPADPAGAIQRAIAFYKQIPAQLGQALSTGGTVITKSLSGWATLIKQYAPQIGIEHVRGIIAGLVAQQPTLLQQARTQMQQMVMAQRQAVVDAKANFVSAFNQLANDALGAFDARMAAWKPPAQRLLDKMQLQDQVKQGIDALSAAMAAIAGGGAAAAADISKTLGPAIGNAMASAISQITGTKTEAALNTVSQRAQQQVTTAINQAAAPALAQAQAAVDAAKAALATAQGGGDPAAIQAAQQALDTAVSNQQALEAAVRAEIEQATGQLVAAEQARHDRIAATQREGLAKQLAELRAELLKHPAEWSTMGAKVQAILASYNVRLQAAGHLWAAKFGDGIRAGIPAAVSAAQALAAAVAAVLPSTSSPLKPAKTGPLAFHPYDMGKQWANNLGAGLGAGGIRGTMGSMAGGGTIRPSGAAAGGGGNVYVTVQGALLGSTVPEVAQTIRREILRIEGRNVKAFAS